MARLWKIVRVLLSLLIMASAAPFLIEGGLSRYAKYGIRPTPNWRYFVLGLIMLAIGALILRPLPWTSQRHRG